MADLRFRSSRASALALAFPNYNLPFLGMDRRRRLIIASLEGGLGEAALLRPAFRRRVLYLFSAPLDLHGDAQYGPLPSWEAAA